MWDEMWVGIWIDLKKLGDVVFTMRSKYRRIYENIKALFPRGGIVHVDIDSLAGSWKSLNQDWSHFCLQSLNPPLLQPHLVQPVALPFEPSSLGQPSCHDNPKMRMQ